MKIVIVNIRFFISGGPERYMFNIIDVLQANGHDVIPFSVKHNLNEPTEYQSYFLDQMGSGDEVYFNKYKKSNIKDLIRLTGRLFYSFEAKRKMAKLIQDTRPDLVYILNFQNKISPSIIDAIKKYNIPVVIRISDFGMICATNLLYSYKDQKVCEKCLEGNNLQIIQKKCFHNSYIYSALKYLAYRLHKFLKIYNKVDAYVIPSKFTRSKYIEYGIPEKKIFRIPTFFNFKNGLGKISYEDFALYVGRIDPDKGIKVLVDAFIGTKYNLNIIGFSMSDYQDFIIEYLNGKQHNISFLGRMDFKDIIPYLQKCRFTIISSEIYDNFPNAILESFAYKKPVIATDIGSLGELVEHERTGLLFEYRNSKDLQEKVKELFNDRTKAQFLGENGYERLKVDFSKKSHYESLIKLFISLTK